MEIAEIQSILKELSLHHGNTQLQGIPDIANQKLAEILGNNYLDMTVKKAKEQLMHFFTNESLLLQEKKFEEACENHIIIKKNSKLEGNERLGLLKDYKLYELLQIAFSPSTHYFQIAPEAFTEFKGDIRELYKKAIDVMLIDPMKVSQSSLDALGIKQLDPDCQNLKEILKSMVSLKYATTSGEEKYTPTINLTPDGKVITLSSQSVIYPATPPATQAEKNKKDVTVQMAVYKDLFSLIRREGHILDEMEGKKTAYEGIITELVSMLEEISWSDYGASIPKKAKNIIEEIQGATSAKVVALKLYNLYTITGRNRRHDDLRIQKAITRFSQRIKDLMGISENVLLHNLELEDQLADQQFGLEMFHTQVKENADIASITKSSLSLFFLAFENYERNKRSYLDQNKCFHEPFQSFHRQITALISPNKILKLEKMKREAGLNGTDEVDLQRYMTKADILMSLQRRFLLAYDLEHKYKEELLSPAEIQKKIQKMLTNDDIKDKYPRELYDAHLAEIDDKRSKFSPEFSHDECVEFFSELKDMSWLQEHFDFLQKSFEKPNLENPTDLEDPD